MLSTVSYLYILIVIGQQWRFVEQLLFIIYLLLLFVPKCTVSGGYKLYRFDKFVQILMCVRIIRQMCFASVVLILSCWRSIFLLRACLALSTAVQSHFWDRKSACFCCHTATNVFSLTEEGTEVILCRCITDTGHLCQNKSVERWTSELRAWSWDAMSPTDAHLCTVVMMMMIKMVIFDKTLSQRQMLSRKIFPPLHGTMWSQRDGTHGNITVCWFHAVLH